MTHLVRVSIFCILRLFSGVYALEPEISCNNPIVGEGDSLTCQCKAKTSPGTPLPNPGPLLSWPGYSNTSVLTVDSVRREENGKIFTCVMVQQGVENKTATHTLLVAYGPSSDDPQIKCDHSSLITDGTKKLTLTCEANHTYPTPHYSWGGLCASNTDSCTCQPRLNQDGSKVFCTAINSVTELHSTTSYTITLRYPPTEAPRIVADTNKTVLSSGDKLTCTIRGGKPAVTSVNFYCTNPILLADIVGENSASSSIIVDTTGAAETPTVCHCSAVWEPDRSLYQNSTSQEFLLEFKATVTNFTVNETTKLTVTEDEEASVVFYCEAAARPTAGVSLLHQNKTRLAFSRATNVTGLNHSRTMYKLSSVRCEDTGVFLCEADNGLSTPSEKSVHLDVLGRPRLYTITNNTDQTPELTEKGVVITLVANPVPDVLNCAAYVSLEPGELEDCHPDIEFKLRCEQKPSMTYLATCSVHPVNVPEEYVGLYNLSISNGLGSYNFSFEVRQAVTQPGNSKDEPHLVAVFVVLWILLIITVIAITIYVQQKRKQRNSSEECEEAKHPELPLSDDSLSRCSHEEEGQQITTPTFYVSNIEST
ncbi:B-cell receptor CD22-like [Littorina saxatilis]|uniref:Ig-like domain-containing protein n=1 Tax=Littorina saxatilis TaxID=31220 RepID=A0AAN9BJF8_9CAEN